MQVEKIHEVREHLGTNGEPGWPVVPRSVGVVNRRFTRVVAFLLITLAMVGCTVICLLAVWNYVPVEYAWRALVSLAVISAAAATFVALNEGFGPTVRG